MPPRTFLKPFESGALDIMIGTPGFKDGVEPTRGYDNIAAPTRCGLVLFSLLATESPPF